MERKPPGLRFLKRKEKAVIVVECQQEFTQ